MLIPKGDGTFLTGPFDVLAIMQHERTKRFHVMFLTESPMPGPYPRTLEERDVIRLQARMHHTEGADTLEGALLHMAEMRRTIDIPLTNIWLKPSPWDGTQGFNAVMPNWLKDPLKAYNDIQEALKDPAAWVAELKKASA